MSKMSNIKKAAWYAVENTTMVAFGLISVIVVARVFGPENLGKLSFIQALSATTMFLVVLGLDHIIVRELARKNDDYDLIFTSMIMQTIGWIAHVILVILAIFVISNDPIEISIIYITISVLLATYFARGTVLKLFFQAINVPKKIAISAIISRIISLSYLTAALVLNLDYHLVIIFIPIQALVQFLVLLIQFLSCRNIDIKSLKFDQKRSKSLIKEALPLIGSSMLFPVFMQGDILLISSILDEKNTGIYSSATRLISQLVFVGHIVTMTFYLALSDKYFEKSNDYESFLNGLIKILFILGFGMALSIYMLSEQIIIALYGEKFTGAEDILKVICWNLVFIFPAALFSRLLVLQNLAKYEFIKSLTIAIFSLSMNFIFIEKYGILGSAVVSLCSYALADLIFYSLFKETRDIFKKAISSYATTIFNPPKAMKNIIKTLEAK
ncbi:oligosaccharide flippase family protein [Grimontia marina]|uniref:Polysaccharide biosynthesis protein n=1 Tax=Grimontia marina TaxID=646534 RepID=A0A128EU51_9GAMM|nr:oligosaccharide flippase family protein [Grimontia marina]CZF77486.1 Polysaccharide biosynthesis protein [Grimontia marina]